MKHIKEWYADRIARGELSLAGWSRSFSQLIRFATTMSWLDKILALGTYDVVDLGAGTGDFPSYYTTEDNYRIGRYVGIEFREDAAKVMEGKGLTVFREIPTVIQSPMDVVISNAAFGFPEQDPVFDLCRVAEVFGVRAIVADFFSARRPYEPTMGGYHPFDPLEIVDGIRAVTQWGKFIIDHSVMPHVFTVIVWEGKTDWEVCDDIR